MRIFYKILAFVTILVCLASCGSLTPVPITQANIPVAITPTFQPLSIRPPAAILEINGKSQQASIGSYCWSNGAAILTQSLCADMAGIPTTREPLVVETTHFSAIFHMPLESPPDSLYISVMPATKEIAIERKDLRLWNLSHGQSSDLPLKKDVENTFQESPGLYVFKLEARWKEWGSVSYGFLVQVGNVGLNPEQITNTPPAQPTSSLQATSIIEPTITQPVPPTPIPETWKTFASSSFNVTLRYPETWTLTTSSRTSGPDGYFEISIRTYAASLFDRLVNLCVIEANDPSLSARYGSAPMISDWQGWDVERQTWFGYGCVVSPSGSDGAQAVLFARDTRPKAKNQLLILRADAAHFGGVLSSLRFIDFATPVPSTGYYDSPFCKETPKAAPVSTYQIGGLVINEYAIANSTCDPWKHFDGFQARIMSLGVDWNTIQNGEIQNRVENANRALAPFGYRLVVQPTNNRTFDLLKGTEAIIKGYTRFSAVSVNAAGDDFILWVQDNLHSTVTSEVRPGGVRTLTGWDEGFNSIWVGNDLITFEYSKEKLFPIGAPAQVIISSNGNQVQIISIPQMGPAGSPVRGLWGWQNHWNMEVAGVLFQDGILQNNQLGYEEIFDWHLVKEKPFFLMRQGKFFGMVYDGQALAIHYDDIIHGDLCCDPARYTIQNFSNGSLFYALRDSVWYLVSVQTAQQ